MTATQKKFPLILKLAIGVVGAACFILILPALIIPPRDHNREKERAAALATDLARATQKYREEIGEFPAGDNAEIVAALRGENPKKTVFFECAADDLGPNGEMVDPWGTPYLFKFDLASSKVLVNSAGPNHAFDGLAKDGTGDDIAASL